MRILHLSPPSVGHLVYKPGTWGHLRKQKQISERTSEIVGAYLFVEPQYTVDQGCQTHFSTGAT